MKITKVYETNRQRNGSGVAEGFYSALIDGIEDDKSFSNFLVTFTTDDTDIKIVPESIRVVNLGDLTACWRGDYFSDALTQYFKKNNVDRIYEFFKAE